MSDFENARF